MAVKDAGPWTLAIGFAGVAAVLHMTGCFGPEAFYRDSGLPWDGGSSSPDTGVIVGSGGSPGSGGSGIIAGTGGSSVAGTGGNSSPGSGGGTPPGSGGRVGSGGTMAGSGGRVGTGGTTAGSGGRVGSGGTMAGSGGRVGTGGMMAGSGGRVGTGGMTPGTGGSTPATACPPGVFCDNFENDTVGAAPGDWPRVGGSAGDWTIIQDTTKAFSQTNRSLTPRLCYSSNTGGGAPWSGATSISGQVKLVADGSSSGNPTTGQICVRYSGGSDGDYYCLAIEEGMGAQIKVRINNTLTEGPMWNSSIALNNWYDLRLSVDGQGVLTGFVGGSMLGTFTPPSVIQSGYVAVATQNAVVAFDNIVVSRP